MVKLSGDGRGKTEVKPRRNQVVVLRRKIAGMSPAALERFILRARRMVRLNATVNVLITSSAHLRLLNHQFRGKDKPTDILSFPSNLPVNGQGRGFAGDLAISAEIARENAKRLGHSLTNEIKILVLHGVLHLAGYDHEQDHGEMARKETKLRRQLKLESGLIERMQSAPDKHPRRKSRTIGIPAPSRKTA